MASYAIYIFDYGAPTGLRLALANPSHTKAIITQNGNAYTQGFGTDFWAPVFALHASHNGDAEREILRATGCLSPLRSGSILRAC